MATPSKYGDQPARDILQERELSHVKAAQAIGCSYQQLNYALRGVCRPATIIRRKLPALLGLPLNELFTPEAIAKPPFTGTGRPRKQSSAVAL